MYKYFNLSQIIYENTPKSIHFENTNGIKNGKVSAV